MLNDSFPMAKQYGNSGQGTDAPARPGNEDRERAKTPGANRDQHRDAAGAAGDEAHKSRDGGKPAGRDAHSQPARQPGGATHSESEKPSTPDSRWGGGNH
jgi:hypothetical protein